MERDRDFFEQTFHVIIALQNTGHRKAKEAQERQNKTSRNTFKNTATQRQHNWPRYKSSGAIQSSKANPKGHPQLYFGHLCLLQWRCKTFPLVQFWESLMPTLSEIFTPSTDKPHRSAYMVFLLYHIWSPWGEYITFKRGFSSFPLPSTLVATCLMKRSVVLKARTGFVPLQLARQKCFGFLA